MHLILNYKIQNTKYKNNTTLQHQKYTHINANANTNTKKCTY